jgi:urocanate hydratase
MVLDGSKEASKRIESMLFWDVNNGISRRSWAVTKELYLPKSNGSTTPIKSDIPTIVADNLLILMNVSLVRK